MPDTERIKRYMAVYVEAVKLLEPANEPVDAWELAQELQIPEEAAAKAILDLQQQKLVVVDGEGRITACNPLPRSE